MKAFKIGIFVYAVLVEIFAIILLVLGEISTRGFILVAATAVSTMTLFLLDRISKNKQSK